MAISADELAQIDALLAGAEGPARRDIELRRLFPKLSWTCCDASDVTEAPFRVYEHYEVHLLDSSDHCAHITSDPACATGVILARRSAVA